MDYEVASVMKARPFYYHDMYISLIPLVLGFDCHSEIPPVDRRLLS